MSYVYIKSEVELWTVGRFTPDGKWDAESDQDSAELAAARVADLNGHGSERPLNRREQFAMAALAGLASQAPCDAEADARIAVAYADALLAELAKREVA